MGRTEREENPRSERQGSDVKDSKGRQAERVSEIEKVGGHTGVRFPVHNHPDKSVVRPGGK